MTTSLSIFNVQGRKETYARTTASNPDLCGWLRDTSTDFANVQVWEAENQKKTQRGQALVAWNDQRITVKNLSGGARNFPDTELVLYTNQLLLPRRGAKAELTFTFPDGRTRTMIVRKGAPTLLR